MIKLDLAIIYSNTHFEQNIVRRIFVISCGNQYKLNCVLRLFSDEGFIEKPIDLKY